MKKRLVISSEQSIISGCAETGLADVTDGLANALASHYEVFVVVPKGTSSIPTKMKAIKEYNLTKFIIYGVQYILIEPEEWETRLPEVIDELKPDILHNLAHPSLLAQLSQKPQKTIYSLDCASYIQDKLSTLSEYDWLTTGSKGYAEELLNRDDELSNILHTSNFIGITHGVTTALCNPKFGTFIPCAFSLENTSGKTKCKEELAKSYRFNSEAPVFVLISRLVKEKGIETVLEAIPVIKRLGGVVIIYGRGNEQYEKILHKLGGNIIWINQKPKLHRVLHILAGADFYLSFSEEEACGLMQRVASLQGVIPITTLVGGLKDDFNSKNAIIHNGNIEETIRQAIELYETPAAFASKRVAAMSNKVDWAYRINEYIKIYEG